MLLAQAATTVAFLPAMPWYAWVAIAAILGGSLTGVARVLTQHRERMAMIQQGIHPDAPRDPTKAPLGEI
jgi:hypothetical protein